MGRIGVRIISSLMLLLVVLVVRPVAAQAVVIEMVLTIDELTKGRAVFSGDLDDTFAKFPTGVNIGTIGTHWEVVAGVFPSTATRPLVVRVEARHKSDPAPHLGEVSPGLLLGGGGVVTHNNLSGLDPGTFGPVGPQDGFHRLIHPGSENHFNTLRSHVDDLNGAAAGFLTADNQLSIRIDLSHGTIPEPSSIILLGTGLLGLAGFRRRHRT